MYAEKQKSPINMKYFVFLSEILMNISKEVRNYKKINEYAPTFVNPIVLPLKQLLEFDSSEFSDSPLLTDMDCESETFEPRKQRMIRLIKAVQKISQSMQITQITGQNLYTLYQIASRSQLPNSQITNVDCERWKTIMQLRPEKIVNTLDNLNLQLVNTFDVKLLRGARLRLQKFGTDWRYNYGEIEDLWMMMIPFNNICCGAAKGGVAKEKAMKILDNMKKLDDSSTRLLQLGKQLTSLKSIVLP